MGCPGSPMLFYLRRSANEGMLARDGETAMSQRNVLRLGGVTAFGGGILTLVGNIFHPREPGQLDSAANLFGVVIRDPMWAADHFVIAIGLALLLHGFYGLTLDPRRTRRDLGALRVAHGDHRGRTRARLNAD